MKNQGLIFTSEECIGCNKCIKGCPVLGSNIAESTEDGPRIVVDGDKCVHCGKCLKNCEHGARHYRDDMDRLLRDLGDGFDIDLLIAPSFFFNYEDDVPKYIGFLKSLGFSHIYNVAFGANITTWAYLSYIKDTGRSGLISSACPVIVDYVEKYLPELVDFLVPIQSPVACLRTYLQKKVNLPSKKYAFLCPCIGKHDETSSYGDGSPMDYTITFARLTEHIRNNRVDISNFYGEPDEIKKPGLGAFYPVPGGLKNNIALFWSEDVFIKQIEGPTNAYSYLKHYAKNIANSDDLPFFVDILNCEGGCTEGVASDQTLDDVDKLSLRLHKSKRSEKMSYPGSPFDSSLPPGLRFDKLNNCFIGLGFTYKDFSRKFNKKGVKHEEIITNFVIENTFKRLHKFTPESRSINCTSCGYSSCHDMAVAIAHGYNRPENCVHYMRDMLEKDRSSLEGLLSQMYTGGGVLDPKNLDSEHIVQLLSETFDDIERQKEQLFNETKAKNQFFASMTHELRTPLNAILNMADSLKEELTKSYSGDTIDSIKNAGTELLDTINELLDISKYESGNFKIISSEYNIMPLISDVGNIIRFRASEKKLHFSMLTDPSIPATLKGDSKRIRQILLNLLGNAVKYTKTGDVTLRTTWNNNKKEPIIQFDISDTGIGIRKEDIPYLFTAYKQVDEAKNHNIEGTGLGLSIVKALCDEMGATVKVKSVYGQGSTFTVFLPQEIEEYTALSETKLSPIAKDKKTLKTSYSMPSAKILVVDDMSVNQHVTATFLEKYQINPDFASSGDEAIEMAKCKCYDLILMDYQMPGMNGLEALQFIRENPCESSKSPTIMMTAEDNSAFESADASSIYQGYLSKPIVREALENALLDFIPEALVKFIEKDVLPDSGFFAKAVSDKDYDAYLEGACALERIAKEKGETQISHMAMSHRLAIQNENYNFISDNSPFLDLQLEALRNIV